MTEIYKPPKMWLKWLFIAAWAWAGVHVAAAFVTAYLAIFVGGDRLSDLVAFEWVIAVMSTFGATAWSSGQQPWERWAAR